MYKKRIKKVTENMREMGLSQIIVTSSAPVYYLTGQWVDPHERMLALYLDDTGRGVLFGNLLFKLNQQVFPQQIHTDNDDPTAGIAKILKPGTVGIDKFWSAKFLISLMEKRPDVRPVIGSAPVDTARLIKDEQEIEALIHASKMNDEVIAFAISSLRDGVTEAELMMDINREFSARGSDAPTAQIVAFGPHCAEEHHESDSTVIKKGDSVIFDLYTPISRYWCDMTRTVFFGEPSNKQKEVYDIVKKANAAGIAAVRPGTPLRDIDRAARSVIESAGYGEYFTHRLGHGLGLDCHEPPDVSAASEAVAYEGMVFSIEPGIYLPGEFGVRIEDLVLVTKDGCRVLTSAKK
ncbi:MAG: aminopeptidase P family protein [Clostridia bacterium]|nr:aminopeptidase P family protein [Clostridia bacterium]